MPADNYTKQRIGVFSILFYLFVIVVYTIKKKLSPYISYWNI